MKHRILVVDDQLGVRMLLQEAFREEGYDVELASCGLEALDKIKRRLPDIVLMDLKMPGMSGLDLLQEIGRLRTPIKVIVMTAYGELEMVSQALKMGVEEYVSKPFDINCLKEIVAKTLQSRAVDKVAGGI